MNGAVVVGVIPARYASSRLPGKPLADICGKPMVVRVWERASASSVLDRVIVATDDGRIQSACRSRGIPVVMTDPDLASGSDRVFEALVDIEYDIAVNIQGDEPLLDPDSISLLVQPLLRHRQGAAVATLACSLEDPVRFRDPNTVKVVCDVTGRALYFSRSPIPHSPDALPEGALQHIGLYAFTREALAAFVTLPASRYEEQERLEQLRMLEAGIPVHVSVVQEHPAGVDTEADLERVRALFPSL